MTSEPELDPRIGRYLRERGDVAVPDGLLESTRAVARQPARGRLLDWLTPALAGGAALAMAAVVAAVTLAQGGGLFGGPGAGGCPVTVPDGIFEPPPPYLPEPPALYGSEWYGTADLWVMLDRDGEVWRGLPSSRHGLGQKTWWWSVNFPGGSTESMPRIAVSGARLDVPGSAPIVFATKGTNGAADFGEAMLVGVNLPEPGCWQLTGAYKGHSVSYTVLVE